LNCPKTELAVSALQVEYSAPKNVVITIEFTTNMTGIFFVSLALLFFSYFILKKSFWLEIGPKNFKPPEKTVVYLVDSGDSHIFTFVALYNT